LYRNGSIVAESTVGSFTPKTTGYLNIGCRPTDPANQSLTFSGVIDEPSVYNRALGSNEIAAIYQAGGSGKCSTTSTSSNTPPVIITQPTNQTVAVGGTATFSVTATGSPTLHYQWYGPASNIVVGAINSTLVLSNVQPSAAGTYFALVTNLYGFAQSSNALLTVTGGTTSNTAPVITHQPTNQTVSAGSTAMFSVSATGSPTLHYRWFGPGSNVVVGAISSTLILTNVQPTNAGTYFAVVTNQYGFATSSNATLVVSSAGPFVANPQPTINLAVKGGTAQLTWPVWAGDFTLQGADNLIPPITWTNVPITLETNGDNIEITLPASEQQGFFRLSHP
jgi:hypothetical protein